MLLRGLGQERSVIDHIWCQIQLAQVSCTAGVDHTAQDSRSSSYSHTHYEFQAVITACLSVLLLGCETRLDAALAQMARMPWSTLEAVS